mmetsp:Transcript_7494/g.11119  ORF Transcript_7494/g.11119 Transcript_7494/m.11119 type:complete len:551 (+) Transcript_7494:61-1713(+)
MKIREIEKILLLLIIIGIATINYLKVIKEGRAFSIQYPNEKSVKNPPSYGYIENYNGTINGFNETCLKVYYPFPKGLYIGEDQWNDEPDKETPYKVMVHKKYNESYIKVQISTAWQCNGNGITCRWEVLINGYRCVPPMIHEVSHNPTGVHRKQETLTGYCKKWSFGGGNNMDAGEYNITLVESSMKSFHQEKWILPDGTRPHGAIPMEVIGNPRIGRQNYPHFFHVSEINETVIRTIKQERNNTRLQKQLDEPTTTVLRSFQFTKNGRSNETFVKITYYDSFQCHTRVDVTGITDADTCYFEVYIDGAQCSPNQVRVSHRTNSHTNYLTGQTLLGRCSGIAEGEHTLEIRAYGNAQPSLGFFSTTAQLEIEEIENGEIGKTMQTWQTGCNTQPYPDLSLVCFPSTEPDRKCNLNCREWQFEKPTNESTFHIEWFDNWYCRVGSCDLEIQVDGLSCSDPGPLTSLYDDNLSRNPLYSTVTTTGFCKKWGNNVNLTAGEHTLTVYDRILSQNTNWPICRDCNYGTNNRPSIGFGATGFMHIHFPEEEFYCQ